MSAPITIEHGPDAREGRLRRDGQLVGAWKDCHGGPVIAYLDDRTVWSIDATGVRDLLTRRGFEVAR